jgi:hypothetical protein
VTSDRVLASASVQPLLAQSAVPQDPETVPSAPSPEPATSQSAGLVEEMPVASASPVMSSNIPQSAPDRKTSSSLSHGSKEERLFNTGARLAMKGNCQGANGYLVRVKILAPLYPETYRYLGDCARYNRKSSVARTYYKEYLSFEGTSPAVLAPQAQALLGR